MAQSFKLNALEGQPNHAPPRNKNILNLSRHNLTSSEISLLDKGLSFIPTPKIVHTPILKAAAEFGRKLKLQNFFYNCPWKKHEWARIPYQGKSTWIPPEDKLEPDLLKCIADFTLEINQLTPLAQTKNITPDEYQAINSLKQNKEIIIKKADKGSATVIMDKMDYIFEAERQINNPLHYKKLSSPCYPETAEKNKTLLNEMLERKLLTVRQFCYLCPPPNPRPRRLYLLPKIHKDEQTWTIPRKIPPGRPIVSDCSSESEKIAELIDDFLKPVSNIHPSYIKDTSDFLSKIKDIEIPPNSFLITLDVDSMYTNIDHQKGIDSIKDAFSNNSNPKLEYVIKFLELSLKQNDFEFNNQFYLQILGTSMGKKFAPHYADIYMAHFEREALNKCLHRFAPPCARALHPGSCECHSQTRDEDLDPDR